MITLTQRISYEWSYRVMLPSITAAVRLLPWRAVFVLAYRADRREAAATYTDGAKRVGILRRQAIDRYDVRSDATFCYFAELKRRERKARKNA